MRVLTLLCACLIFVFAGMTGQAQAGVLIEVDKSTQRMSVSVDGKERYSWPVSTGLTRYATPGGSYTPFRLEEDHRSKEWDDAPMPHSIFFTGRGHAIHGSDAVRSLGAPASHGCVRLSRANAAALFALVKEEGLGDTKIVIRGDEQIAMARKAPKTRTVARERPRPVQSRPAPDSYWTEPAYAPAQRSYRGRQPLYAPLEQSPWW